MAKAVQFELQTGASLIEAAGAWMLTEGHNGAMLLLEDVPVRGLSYVLPAASTDPRFAAHYSPDHVLMGPGVIRSGRMTLGWRNSKPFAHCHGLFEDARGELACGHLRVETAILDQNAAASGFAVQGAAFMVQPCQETNFDLLTPVLLAQTAANAVIVKLSPNQEVGMALLGAAAENGLENASIYGLGSLVGATFEDGRSLDQIETEFFFTRAELKSGRVELDVTIVEKGGRRLSGRLAPGMNAVLMTAEILIIGDPSRSPSQPQR